MIDQLISILVPYRSDKGCREKAWKWIRKRYELLLPEAELIIGDTGIEPYCKAAAVNSAAGFASRDILVIADADIAFDIELLEAGMEQLSRNPWVIPFVYRRNLSCADTNCLLSQDPTVNLSGMNFTDYENYYYDDSTPCWDGTTGGVGCINIVPRKHFEAAGGFDERFTGWGFEDNAFQMSLDAMCGMHARLEEGVVWHLFHPQAPTPTLHTNSTLYYTEYGSLEIIRKNRGMQK